MSILTIKIYNLISFFFILSLHLRIIPVLQISPNSTKSPSTAVKHTICIFPLAALGKTTILDTLLPINSLNVAIACRQTNCLIVSSSKFAKDRPLRFLCTVKLFPFHFPWPVVLLHQNRFRLTQLPISLLRPSCDEFSPFFISNLATPSNYGGFACPHVVISSFYILQVEGKCPGWSPCLAATL